MIIAHYESIAVDEAQAEDQPGGRDLLLTFRVTREALQAAPESLSALFGERVVLSVGPMQGELFR